MTKIISTQAQAAKLIRTEIKKAFPAVKVRVTSTSYSGGNSVDVNMTDQAPAVKKAIEAIAGKYQYGHFDSMNDIYEYSNTNDLPQVKYVFVRNELSEEMHKIIATHLKNTFAEDDFIFIDIRQSTWREFCKVESEIWR